MCKGLHLDTFKPVQNSGLYSIRKHMSFTRWHADLGAAWYVSSMFPTWLVFPVFAWSIVFHRRTLSTRVWKTAVFAKNSLFYSQLDFYGCRIIYIMRDSIHTRRGNSPGREGAGWPPNYIRTQKTIIMISKFFRGQKRAVLEWWWGGWLCCRQC